MRKIRIRLGLLLTLAVLVAVLGVPSALAEPARQQTARVIKLTTGDTVATIVARPAAPESVLAVVALGEAFDRDERVEGYAFIRYRNGAVKPSQAKPGRSTTCYAFLSKATRWKVTEPFVVGFGVNAASTGSDLETWDEQVSFDLFGPEDTASVADGADTASPDGKNEIMFGVISEPDAIAVTTVWGIFGGPLSNRKLVEYDVVFDSFEYPFGDATLDPSVMDYDNIAVHEFGHAAGLADLYQTDCREQTMYGYADYGETKKRTLESGDVAGIHSLYR